MKLIIQAGLILTVLTVCSGVLYPSVVTGIGQLLFADKSNGSLIRNSDTVVGSELIAQQFASPRYFWPRPSASSFNAVPSGASNFGPTNSALAAAIDERRKKMANAHSIAEHSIPADMLTTSGSGLDPHISRDAARMQIARIVEARGLDATSKAKIENAIDEHVEARQLHILGEERVNVLLLNLAIDKCCQRQG